MPRPGLLSFLHQIPARRPWVWALIVINGLGSIYGFLWYKEQLANTPWYLWPVVPDSPLSTLLFTLYLGFYLARRPFPYLGALAQMGTFKYGLWTVVVLGGYMVSRSHWDWEFALLVATHAGMALEAYLFMAADPQHRRFIWGAAAWLVINDFFDYIIGTHPAVPDPGAINQVALQAVALTVLATVLTRVARGGRSMLR